MEGARVSGVRLGACNRWTTCCTVGASPSYYRRNPRWPISNQDELFFHFQYFFRTNPSLDTPAMSNVYDVHISLSWLLAVFILVKSF